MTHQISSDDVAQLATLSAISVSDAETEALRDDIANILGYIEQLSELDTTGVEPTYQVTGLQNVFRDDEIMDQTVSSETILAGAPESDEHQFKVPKVL